MTVKPAALHVYIILRGFFALFLATIFTVAPLYRIQTVGMSPLELVTTGTIMELTIFLCEVPTGVVADTYSRRWSIIIGLLILGAASVLEGWVPLAGAVFLAQVIWGIGYTFTSGATDAWIVDEVGEDQASAALVRGAQAGQIGGLAGIGLSVLLGSAHLQIPIVAGGLSIMALGLVLIAIMPETGFRPAPRGDRSGWQQLRSTFGAGLGTVRGSSILLLILLIGGIAGASSEGFDRLWLYHFEINLGWPSWIALSPVGWVGLLSASTLLMSLIVTQLLRQRIMSLSQRQLTLSLLAIHGLLIVSLVVFGLSGNFWLAVSMYWSVTLLRTTNSPLYAIWLNNHVPGSVRATVLSMSSQLDALGQIVGGPMLGALGNSSVRAAMLGAAMVLVPGLALYQRMLRLDAEAGLEVKGQP